MKLLFSPHSPLARFGYRHLAIAMLLGIVSAAMPAHLDASEVHRRVKDINSGDQPFRSNPRHFFALGTSTFFSAETPSHGRELWITDGTEAGTHMVKDIFPGPTGGTSFGIRAALGGAVVFFASDGIHGTELWRSDGTEAGTEMIIDLDPGTGGQTSVESPVVFGGELYFVGSDGTTTGSYGLWKTDGTAVGTQLVKDFDQRPVNFMSAGGTLFFSADDGGAAGRELWKTDGNESGTVLVKDLRFGSPGSNPEELTDVNGTLFFTANVAPEGDIDIVLCKSDGTTGGTVVVKDTVPGSSNTQLIAPRGLTAVGGTLFFAGNDPATGYELWKSNGTTAGTFMVEDIWPGTGSGVDRTGSFGVLGSQLVFEGREDGNGAGVWRSDGTAAGTFELATFFDSMDDPLTVGGVVYFPLAIDASLWRSDGTTAGTFEMLPPGTIVGEVSRVGSNLLFRSDNLYPGAPGELLTSDGTTGNVSLVKDIGRRTYDSDPEALIPVGETLFFTAEDGTNGRELRKSDGTGAGTSLVADIRTGASGQPNISPLRVGDEIYFDGYDDLHGSELWKSDGSVAGTVRLTDLRPGSDSSVSEPLGALGSQVLFRARDADAGWELWATGGTPGDAFLVKDINPGSDDSYPGGTQAVVMDGVLYFDAETAAYGTELWRTDGTQAGTWMVADIGPGTQSGLLRFGSEPWGKVVQNTLFFAANDGLHGYELWKTDGTAAGTARVRVNPPYAGIKNGELTAVVMDEVLYFTGNDGSSGDELWRSDGTEGGTHLIKDIDPGSADGLPLGLDGAAAGGFLYFSARDTANEWELWRTDGTESGTELFADLRMGNGGSGPQQLTAWLDRVYFVATGDSSDRNLWRTDGTIDGTVSIPDDLPNSPSDPENLTIAGNRLYFSADHPEFGRELHVLDLPPPGGDIVIEQPADTPLVAGSSTIDFGSIPAGDPGLTQVFTVRNEGNLDLNLGTPLISGDAAGDFSINTSGWMSVLSPGDSTTFSISFTPSAEGPRAASLQVPSDDPDTPDFVIGLAGTGAPPPVSFTVEAPTWSVVGGLYSFAPEATTTGNGPITFTVLQKPDWLDFDGTTLSGTPPSDREGLEDLVVLRATDGDGETVDLSYRINIGRLAGPAASPPGGGTLQWVTGMPQVARSGGDTMLATGVLRADEIPVFWGLAPDGFGMKMDYTGPSGSSGEDFVVPEDFAFTADEVGDWSSGVSDPPNGLGVWQGITNRPASIGGAEVLTFLHAEARDIGDTTALPLVEAAEYGLPATVGALARVPNAGDLRVGLRLHANAVYPSGSPALDWFNSLSGKLATDRTVTSVTSGFYWVNTVPKLTANTGLALDQDATVMLTPAHLDAEDFEENAAGIRFELGDGGNGGPPRFGSLEVDSGGSWSPVPASGSFTLDDLENGRVRYVQDGSYETSDGFQFRVIDEQGGVARDGSFTVFTFPIAITLVNHPPVAVDQAVDVGLGLTITGQLDFSDPDSGFLPQSFTVSPTSTAQIGTFSITDPATGDFTYTSDGAPGVETITWEVSDGELTDSATLTIEVENQAPTIEPVVVEGTSDSTTTGEIVVLDPDGDPAEVTIGLASPPAKGTVVFDGTTFHYTPADGRFGKDEFTVRASDPLGAESAEQTVTLNIRPTVLDHETIVVTARQSVPADGDEGIVQRLNLVNGDVYTLARGLGNETRGLVWSETLGKLLVIYQHGPSETPSHSLVAIDPLTGDWDAPDVITTDGDLAFPVGLALDGDTHVLVANGPGGVVRVELATGTQQPLALGLPPGVFAVSVLPDPTGGSGIWVGSIADMGTAGDGALYLCDRDAGTSSEPVSFSPAADPGGLAAWNGDTLAVVRTGVPVETIGLDPLDYTSHPGTPAAPWSLPASVVKSSVLDAWLVTDPFAGKLYQQPIDALTVSETAAPELGSVFAVATVVGPNNTEVLFEDAALEAALRAALRIAEGPITGGDMETLETLDLRGLGITDLGGLETATNLRILNLRHNIFADPAAAWAILDQLTLHGLFIDIPRPEGHPTGLATEALTDTSSATFYITVDTGELAILDITGLGFDSTNPANLAALKSFTDAGVELETGPDNFAPAPSAAFTILDATTGEVSFDGSASGDVDGSVVQWRWTWLGGDVTGVNPTVSLPSGSVTITLTVTDNEGATSATVFAVELPTSHPTPQLVKDLFAGQQNGASDPDNFVVLGDTLFFTATTPATGRELWKSDGTATGTVLVSDIWPGGEGSDPQGLTTMNGILYFSANDGASGIELWKSDGTAAGTIRVKDIRPGPDSALFFYSDLTSVGSTLYFVANDGVVGNELWKSDGTEAGTQLVKDIYPGYYGGYPSHLTAVGNTLFFEGNDAATGNELWKSDGTPGGTVRVKDIRSGTGGSSITNLVVVGSTLFFSADDGSSGAELWKSDGSSGGTIRVKDIHAGSPGSDPRYLVAAGGLLYFAANDGSGSEPWRSDGSSAGTVRLKDIRVGASGSDPREFTAVGDVVFFPATDDSYRRELWKSDGTSAGTVLVKEIGIVSSSPSQMVGVGENLYFTAYTYQNGRELWKSDGTESGTLMVGDLRSTPSSTYSSYSQLTAAGDRLFFAFDDGVAGNELWTSDGTESGTAPVIDLVGSVGASSSPDQLTVSGSTLFFEADDGNSGAELWKTDGTESGTVLVKDIRPPSVNGFVYGSDLDFLTPDGTGLFFRANDGTSGYELWVTDGTEAGTMLVKDLTVGYGNSYPADFVMMGGTLFFRASDGSTGYELWRSDGTEAGTFLVKDIRPGFSGSSPSDLTPVGETLYFVANDGSTGSELWKSDGTEAGTVRVKDIRPGSASSSPTELTVLGSIVFFRANDGTTGSELWRSDGSAAGTFRVKDIQSGSGSSSPALLTNAGGTLFFRADDGSTGRELWKSDGTAGGTVRIKDILPGPDESRPSELTAADGLLYFTAYDPATGYELWKSDGTGEGTIRVIDIWSGPGNSSPTDLTPAGSFLFFSAYHPSFGRELWKSDGTEQGTMIVSNQRSGAASADPSGLTMLGTRLYFAATGNMAGRELYYVTTAPPQPVLSLENADGDQLVSGVSESDFGSVTVSAGEVERTFTIVNSGNHDLAIEDIALTGADFDEFAVNHSFLVNPVPAGSSSSFRVMFSPRIVGDRNATLRIVSNDFTGQNFELPLTGIGITPDQLVMAAIDDAGLAGDDARMDAVPFDDGVENLLKFAFNMNLAGPDSSTMIPGGTSGLPSTGLIEKDGVTYWQVEYVVRKASGLVYEPLQSTTLEPGSFEPMTGEVTETDIDDEWKRVTVKEPCDPATTPRCFSRVRVTVPE